jgi:hypothetical protein
MGIVAIYSCAVIKKIFNYTIKVQLYIMWAGFNWLSAYYSGKFLLMR